AQSLDVLSSQANIAGYKAVLVGAHHYPRFMPMLMTAAGTVKAARVLILGAGVAGLQAIATAKRLGAVVEASDVRPAVKEQIESLGAKFVDVPLETDEERESPGHWRFWKRLPARGQIAVFFGSWYTYPIVERAFERMDEHVFLRAMNRINDLERLLTLDGMLVIKLWFHLSKDDQEKRLNKLAKDNGRGKGGRRPTPWEKTFTKRYDVFAQVAESAIRATDSGASPWHLIESKSRRHRDLCAGRVILAACEARVAEAWTTRVRDATSNTEPAQDDSVFPASQRTILDTVDLTATISDEDYRSQLAKYQRRLGAAVWDAWGRGIASVVVFEGWDAAGKGGAIRRLTAAMDARLFRVVAVGAPTDEERAFHYLWRFWKHVPRDGYLRIFDRSWYGRVLVERVEGFATPAEWRRAYREITHFEGQLTEHGVVVTKLWLHLS
ncbi:MAG: hypothetical protein CVV17_07940, partial [Gammaproteobacteria bacterium HGW-Gammaproteobacteria-7]